MAGFVLFLLILVTINCTAITSDSDPPDVQQEYKNKNSEIHEIHEIHSQEQSDKLKDKADTESGEIVYPLISGSKEEIEGYYGKVVRVYGMISNVDGRHAILKLASGVVLYIAHIDKQVSNLDWFSFIGREITVVAKVSAETDNLIDNKLPGPFLYNVLSVTPGHVSD